MSGRAPVISGVRLAPSIAGPAGAGTPSSSRTVGRTSIERTESVTCRCFIAEYGARTSIGTWTTLS
jgi:hypothetical protein